MSTLDTQRPGLAHQDTTNVLSYYFHDDDNTDSSEAPSSSRRPARTTPQTDNRRLAIVEVDRKESDPPPRRFDRSRLALIAPPDTAPSKSTHTTGNGNTSPSDVDTAGGSFSALMDQPPVTSLAPLPVFQQSNDRSSTPMLTPAIGDSKQIGTKVAPPVMTRLGSQDTWLPPSPTKPVGTAPPSRGAPPPRPPRLSSPPPRTLHNGSPATSFRSLASTISPASHAEHGQTIRLAAPPGLPMARGNSDYSIMAMSDNSTSERTTPRDEVSEPTSPTEPQPSGSGSSHRREGAFPAHSVFTSHGQSIPGEGLPDSSSSADERAFYLDSKRPLRVVGESEDGDEDEDEGEEERVSHGRKNTITSRSSRTHTATPSSTSHYTQSSASNYTSSNVSRKQTLDRHEANGTHTDDMEDLIATVGSALSDLGFNPADVPPATVFPPSDESKPSRPGSVDGHGTRSSPLGSTVNLVQTNGSPRTSMGDYTRGSPRTSIADLARGSPRASMSDLARGSSRTGSIDFPRTEGARGSPRPSMTELSRGSPRPSLRGESRSRSQLNSRATSPEKRAREVSPDKGKAMNGGRIGRGTEKPRMRETKSSPDPHGRGHVRSRSPEKGGVPTITRSSYESTSPDTARSTSTGSNHTYPSPQTPTSPRSNAHISVHNNTSPQSAVRTLPRARSSTSLARGARSSPLRNVVDQPKFRQSGAPMPECFAFADVLKMKTSAERAQGYVRKINQLAAEDSGLGYWVGFMKGRVRPEVPSQSTGPISPSALITTFGPHGPGTRRQQPRHVSGGSTTSEATFAVRPDAYVATNISVRAESPPLGPPPSLPYPSLARDIGVRAIPPSSPLSNITSDPASILRAVPGIGPSGLRTKAGAVGFFSSIGRKASTRRDRDRAVMQQARKPHHAGNGGGYAELPAAVRPVQLSAVPTIPGGPRARGVVRRDTEMSRRGEEAGTSGGGANLNPRASVIMIGGRDSFQTMSHDGNGRPVSIRVPSSNGHGVITPNLPPNASPSPVFGSSPAERERERSGMRSPEAPSSYRGVEGGSVYSGYSGRESGYSARESIYGVRGSSVPGHGGNLDQLADVLPHVDRAVLAGYLERAGGHEIDAISAYLEDEKRANAGKGGAGGATGGGYI